MHSRASLFCPIDNTARLFNHHQTSKAMTIISIIPTTVGQVIIATKFSLQPEFGESLLQWVPTIPSIHWYSFLPDLTKPHSLQTSLLLGSRELTSDTEAPISTRASTFLSPSNTLQVKSGPSFSKRYTCAFLLPVCSLPSSRFLDNQDKPISPPPIRVRVVPFGVVHLSPARTGSSQMTRSSTAPTPSLLTSGRKVPDHTTYLSAMSEQRKPKNDLPEVRRSVFCFIFLLLLFPSLFPLMSLSDQYSPKTRVLSGLTRF
ncbi:unnamed protein product [Acanthosepion pharaonis]|uniref:Uncharacterized protein n=1 Tax=Acanthosepion pharaonis TaxID=158019 RepID=A0A812AS96_ACAPH|nr:unnamed protein product [Sepia pharaonis]